MENMFNKILNVLLVIFMICCSSCNNKSFDSKSQLKQPMTIVRFTNDTLSLDNISHKNVSIFVQNENVFSFYTNEMNFFSYPCLEVVRKCKDKNEIALHALKNDNTLQIKVVVTGEIDTIYNYNILPYHEEENVSSISGECAPLVSLYSNYADNVEIKKWLFRKKEYLDNEDIHLLSGLINQLSKTDTIEYVTNSTIPVINSFIGKKYKVKSSVLANHYVLYACSSMEDLNEFIEYTISNDFDLCSNTLSDKMDCFRKAESNGYKCICLLAINNDWNYIIQPLGLVAIDNMAPEIDMDSFHLRNSHVSSYIDFPNNVKVRIPDNKNPIDGFCNVRITRFPGNGIECNVSFLVNFSGDVKSVTIKRTKQLCYLYTHKVENKVVDLTNKTSPYQFSYVMHLIDGDNYIPVIVEDNHGNKHEFELNQRAEFVYGNSNDINLENNINIYN